MDPRHFTALDGEEKVRHLASLYDLDPDNVVSQWRLAHQFVDLNTAVDVDLLAVYKQIPQTYSQLRCLYRVLLTLPVTTASVERSFFQNHSGKVQTAFDNDTRSTGSVAVACCRTRLTNELER